MTLNLFRNCSSHIHCLPLFEFSVLLVVVVVFIVFPISLIGNRYVGETPWIRQARPIPRIHRSIECGYENDSPRRRADISWIVCASEFSRTPSAAGASVVLHVTKGSTRITTRNPGATKQSKSGIKMERFRAALRELGTYWQHLRGIRSRCSFVERALTCWSV